MVYRDKNSLKQLNIFHDLLCTRFRNLLIRHYSIAMEICAAIYNCTMDFLDNGAACNTSLVNKAVCFIASNTHTPQYITRRFESYCSPEEENSTMET